MSKEVEKYNKMDKADTKIFQLITTEALPSINRSLKSLSFTGIDQNKLISRMVVMEGSINDLKEKTKVQKPIRKIFPYYDELVDLGVKPEIIEDTFYDISEDKPYERDTLNNPSLLYIPNNLPSRFNSPIAGITTTIIMLDIMGAPMPKEVNNPDIQDIAKRTLRQHTIEVTLRKFIAESEADFQDPRFDSVKERITQDLDAKETRFFFFGAQILGVLEGQAIDGCAFNMGEDLHQDIAFLLAAPVLETALVDIKINPIDVHGIMREFKRRNNAAVAKVLEEIELDFSSNGTSAENERPNDYKFLSSLYLNSQVPLLVAMGKSF